MLSKALCERNEEALELIHEHYYHRIKSYIACSVGSGQDAEDLTQEVFVELSKKNDQNKEYDNPIAYLFGISRNIIKNYFQEKNQSVKTIPITTIDEDNTNQLEQNDSFEKMFLSERRQIIELAVAKLSPKTRQAIKLRFIDGLSVKEACAKEQCSPDVFSRRLYDGIKVLRTIIFQQKKDIYRKIV